MNKGTIPGEAFRSLVEAAPLAVFDLDPGGRVKSIWNGAAEEIFGWKKEEVIGNPLPIVPEEEAEEFEELKNRVLAGESFSGVEVERRKKDGTRIDVRISTAPVRDEEGKVVRIISLAEEITIKKELERSLRESEKEFREIFNHANDALYFQELTEDLEAGKFIKVNDKACEMLGYSREELLEMSPGDIDAGEDVDVTRITKEITSKGHLTFETAHEAKDGTRVPVEISTHYFELGGENRVLSIARDISERKEAQRELEEQKERLKLSRERYRKYFDELGDAVFITKVGGGDHGRILDVNSSALEQTGYAREELVGMNIEEDIAVNPPEMGYEEADSKLSQGETISFVEKKRKKDGTEYWTEVVISSFEHDEGLAALSVNRDITEKRATQERLKQYKMAVEESEELMAAVDQNYNYLFANQAYREFYGISEEDLLENQLGDLIRDEDFLSSVKPKVDRCLEGERVEYEMTRQHPERGERLLSIIYYPLRDGGEIHGAVAVLRDITDRRMTQRALNEQKEKLKNLHDAVDELQHREEEEEILSTAVEVAESMLDFKLCNISLVEEDHLVPRASTADLDPTEPLEFRVGEGVAGTAVEKGETIWGDDLRDRPETKLKDESFRAFINVPIGELGVLEVISEEEGAFDEQDVELAEILAEHLREEINRVRLEEDLRRQAIRDPLTGLYNRRFFNESLEKKIREAERYDKQLAFLMIDVNRFKEINDRYSHQTGDGVLQEVAELLRENVRDADTVVRYGGDEFLIMLPRTKGEVSGVVKRLEAALDHWNEKTDLLDFPLSLAMGVSCWCPDQDRDVEEALKEADEKMYEDKGE